MISIRSLNNGFRRAGEAFTREHRVFADDHFTEEQMAALTAEPMLEVRHQPDPEPELPEPEPAPEPELPEPEPELPAPEAEKPQPRRRSK